MKHLPQGYKQTQLGTIPEDWRMLTVKDLVNEAIIEKPMDGNHGNIHPKSEDFVSTGIPFIMANNIKNGNLSLATCSYILKKQAESLQKGFAVEGDVLLTHKGSVGSVAIVQKLQTEYIMLTPQVTYYRVKDTSKISNAYIKCYFESARFQGILKRLSGGGTRAYIGITNQRKLPFLLPPLPEQQKIATILSTWDQAIASIQSIIDTLTLRNKGLAQQLLTRNKRLKGFQGKFEKQKKDKSYNRYPMVKLGTLVNFLPKSKRPASYGKEKGAYPFFTSSSKQSKYVDFPDYTQESIIIGDGGVSSLHIHNQFSVSDHNFILQVHPNQSLSSFIYLVLKHKFFLITEGLQGSTLKNISKKHLKSIQIPLPSLEEQKAIAQVLVDAEEEVKLYKKKLDKLQEQKKGLMQKLLTGSIRVLT